MASNGFKDNIKNILDLLLVSKKVEKPVIFIIDGHDIKAIQFNCRIHCFDKGGEKLAPSNGEN